jgi:glutathione S-transferase
MKLHHSPASPFVRKVMACAIARGIDGQIELVRTNPHESPANLLADNPLSKIPALVTDDGVAIPDSPVICEYLDGIGDAPKLIPAAGPQRLAALVQEALADGLMDAAVGRRGQMGHPQDEARAAWSARQKAIVERTLAAFEAKPPTGLNDIGAISVACALGYLDFRYAAEPWRDSAPKLAAWFESVSALPPLALTKPVG